MGENRALEEQTRMLARLNSLTSLDGDERQLAEFDKLECHLSAQQQKLWQQLVVSSIDDLDWSGSFPAQALSLPGIASTKQTLLGLVHTVKQLRAEEQSRRR